MPGAAAWSPMPVTVRPVDSSTIAALMQTANADRCGPIRRFDLPPTKPPRRAVAKHGGPTYRDDRDAAAGARRHPALAEFYDEPFADLLPDPDSMSQMTRQIVTARCPATAVTNCSAGITAISSPTGRSKLMRLPRAVRTLLPMAD